MTLPLSPEILEAAYDYLLVTPPFRGWKLPSPDGVVFHVSAEWISAYYTRNHDHHIVLSSKRVGTTEQVIALMAHEMIHLRQAVAKTETPHTEHNAEFDRLAKRVCRFHGWGWKEFYR